MKALDRPAGNAGEREQLVGWLDVQRSLVRVKCDGLSDEDAHRKLLPASPLMSVAGIVSHLRWVEYSWFNLSLLGIPEEDTPWTRMDHDDAEFFVDDIPLAQLLDEYDAECARSNEIVAAHSLDDMERGEGHQKPGSVRYILCHMIEETARHVGHLDILRELLDGKTGYVSS